MRDPARIPATLAALGGAWESSPDLRLGQLIDNVSVMYRLPLFHAEDDAWLAALTDYAARRRAIGNHAPGCPAVGRNEACLVCGLENDNQLGWDVDRPPKTGSAWCSTCWDNHVVTEYTPRSACTCPPPAVTP